MKEARDAGAGYPAGLHAELVAERLLAGGVIGPEHAAAFPDPAFFCRLPWTAASILPGGELVPCCFAQPVPGFGDLREATMEQAWNAPALRALRLDMLRGRENPACARCYRREQAGLPSLRTVTRARDRDGRLPMVGRTAPDGSLPDFRPWSLEVRFSNACNLRCRYCGPHFSSAWRDDAVSLGRAVPDARVTTPTGARGGLLAEIERLLPGLAHLEFLGGEPLLMDEHQDLLDLLAAKGRFDLSLGYSTNLTTLDHRGRDATKDWARFRAVTVRVSLDAAGARGEYLRKGLRWEAALRNRERMKENCPGARVILAATVGALNALCLPDLLSEWLRRPASAGDELDAAVLAEPEHYGARVLPAPLKREARRRCEAFLERERAALGDRAETTRRRLEELLAYMDSGDDSRLLPRLLEETRRLDALRGEDLASVFPELAELAS
ncbi:MAG: twitch domain-containing radical SAM protein [Elusimicrobiota bacterium]|nr:twitch domain-containing radical SAM protein [Elusimicrobiota bacterium]